MDIIFPYMLVVAIALQCAYLFVLIRQWRVCRKPQQKIVVSKSRTERRAKSKARIIARLEAQISKSTNESFDVDNGGEYTRR